MKMFVPQNLVDMGDTPFVFNKFWKYVRASPQI
jgi:hypothetical protein